ncbi:MAG: hypothetical protein COA97_03985 [Flavobacteriales bacterium]|nr:MAG: hypothetical protein COA97_03985 [Flavobacteriales bacterium]
MSKRNVTSSKLRIEVSENNSGELLNEKKIEQLKEKNYYVKKWDLDGDAPKQFIKAYFYIEESGIRKINLKTWIPYVAKSAEKWYPHESVTEYMINRIGEEMGLLMNEVKLVKANNQIRFLSKYFLNKGEILVHGAEICGEHLGDMDMAKEIAINRKTARELFNFEFIEESIYNVFPDSCHDDIMDGIVKMIAFDGLVGNNDRHFYNWGVIDNTKRSRKVPKFAPLYDSARGLLWNFSDENIVRVLGLHNNGGKKVVNYIEKAYPRISLDKNKEANHFELISFVKLQHKSYKKIINELSTKKNEERVLRMLEIEFFPFFIEERAELIKIIIKDRFERVRKI